MLLRPLPAVMSSVLTRPANTTAYAQNDLIASNVTAGSVVVPYLQAPRDDAEILEILRGILYTNLTTGFTTFQGHIDLWLGTPPTFTNGDNGAFAVATGWANWVGHLTSAVADAYSASGDGAALRLVPGSSSSSTAETIPMKWSKGQKLYWSLREIDSTGFTPISGQTFTLALQANQH